jgi:hypothetical protein
VGSAGFRFTEEWSNSGADSKYRKCRHLDTFGSRRVVINAVNMLRDRTLKKLLAQNPNVMKISSLIPILYFLIPVPAAERKRRETKKTD